MNPSLLMIYLAALVVALHGLIHLLGFIAYWPLANVPSLPYKTALLEGRLEVGGPGMQVFAALWLVAAVGYLGAVVGLVRGAEWWLAAMLAVTVLSFALTSLDWRSARVGAVVDAAILVALVAGRVLIGPQA